MTPAEHPQFDFLNEVGRQSEQMLMHSAAKLAKEFDAVGMTVVAGALNPIMPNGWFMRNAEGLVDGGHITYQDLFAKTLIPHSQTKVWNNEQKELFKVLQPLVLQTPWGKEFVKALMKDCKDPVLLAEPSQEKSPLFAHRVAQQLRWGNLDEALNMLSRTEQSELPIALGRFNLQNKDHLEINLGLGALTHDGRESSRRLFERRDAFKTMAEAAVGTEEQQAKFEKVVQAIEDKCDPELAKRFRLWTAAAYMMERAEWEWSGPAEGSAVAKILKTSGNENPLAPISQEIEAMMEDKHWKSVKPTHFEKYSNTVGLSLAQSALETHCLPLIEATKATHGKIDPLQQILRSSTFVSPEAFEDCVRALDAHAQQANNEPKSLMQRLKDIARPAETDTVPRLTLETALHHLASLTPDVKWEGKLNSLLKLGADPEGKNHLGQTPMEAMPQKERFEEKRVQWQAIVQAFEAGVDVDQTAQAKSRMRP